MSGTEEVKMDFRAIAQTFEPWVDRPGYPLERSFPKAEYEFRLARARRLMREEGLDALAITTRLIGQWFTGPVEPHEWHDVCQARSAWFILTADGDYLFMTPTAGGEHFNTTRRSTWVTHVRGIAERNLEPRSEIWDIRQMPDVFADLGLAQARIGFELGDCMTLGISTLDFLRLRDLMPKAALVDGSKVIRKLMAVLTPFEIDHLRQACAAGLWIHDRTPDVLKPGMREDEFQAELGNAFRNRFPDRNYHFELTRHWDIRNGAAGELHCFHQMPTDRKFKAGDLVFRGASGVSFRGYFADIDRLWFIGDPPAAVLELYKMTWECNRAMAEKLAPGVMCSEVYQAGAKVEKAFGLPPRPAGRTGHGYRNTGGLSIHPDCNTVLEPGMIVSVEPMHSTDHGFFDLEDQYLITERSAECLHGTAPEVLPVV